MNVGFFIILLVLLIAFFNDKLIRVVNALKITLVFFVILYLVIIFTPHSFKESIPLFRVDTGKTTLEYDASYTVYVNRDYLLGTDELFYISSGINELDAWLNERTFGYTYFEIAQGGDVLYSKSISSADEVKSILSTWKTDNTLPVSYYKYWFLCFYLQKNI